MRRHFLYFLLLVVLFAELCPPRRHEATPQMWQEVYLSAILRAILYADDPSYRLAGFRKLDPITSLDAELRFVAAAEAAFFKGARLKTFHSSCALRR